MSEEQVTAPVDAPAPESPRPLLAAVVCLGASAGGLEALSTFFSSLPVCADVAFVVVQHLSPDHKTMMHDLLGHQTPMAVSIARHEQELVGGHVYVIPPGMTMTLLGERLQLVPKPAQGLSLPIDDFFQSLAEHFGPKAVGVILSGTGSDGSRGVQTLANAGGTVLVQSPMSARFDGMPRSAIATGVADAVGTPTELAEQVATMVRSATWPAMPHEPVDPLGAATPSGDPTLSFVLQTLRALMRIDFSDYKPDMLIRRLQRRMQSVRATSMDEYLARMEVDTEEVDALRRDLLIPVTRFMRDLPAWEALRDKALTTLVDRQSTSSQPVRAWVAACSTGEEAYTVAMMLADLSREHRLLPDFKVFATDVEQQYIDRASVGRFPAGALAELPEVWRERYFDASSEGVVQIKPELRQHIVFARHNLLADAPFTQMDLVTCRNMLIYLRPQAQERALRRLEYALKTPGVLFLGSSETPAGTANDLSVIDQKHKIYLLTRKAPPLPAEDLRSTAVAGARRHAAQRQSLTDARLRDHRAVDGAGEALISQYAPPALLINAQRELVHVFGGGRRFVSFRSGSASLDVLDLLPAPLPPVVATLVHSALRDRCEKRSREVLMQRDAGSTGERICVSVRPLGDQGSVEHLLVCFEPMVAAPEVETPTVLTDVAAESQRHVDDLERELADTRDNLQSTIQELGLSNEELQATNEELMASNEELQSTNEELQSVNEELHTVNSEFQLKIDALNAANADLESLTMATHLPIVFVDGSLQLSRFTPEAKSLFRLRDADVGRSLEDIAHRLDYPDLFVDIRRAVANGVVSKREVRSHDGAWYLTTVQPYSDPVQRSTRAVLTFVDVTTLKDAQRLQAVLDSLPEHVALLDAEGRIILVNRAWRDFAERNGDVGVRSSGPGVSYLEVCRRAGAEDAYAHRAAEGLLSVLRGSQPGFVMQYPCHSDTEKRWFLMQAAPLQFVSGGCVVSHLNVTAWVENGRGMPDESLALVDLDPPIQPTLER